MPNLAQRTSKAVPSAIMQVAEKAKALKAAGRDIISFSIGVPNFLPGEHVYDAAREAIKKDTGQYGSNRGPDPLLDAYLAHLRRNGIEGYERKNIVVGMGAKFVLFNAMYAMLDEGDEVVFQAPYWTSYVDIANILGAKVKLIECGPEQHYKMTAAQVDAAVTSSTKLFLFNNPSNPTGMIYSEAEVQAIGEVLARKDCWIISDDIYNQMVFDGIKLTHLVSLVPALRERTLILDSLSKTYGMPGWRIGFMAGPSALANALTTFNSNHLTNVPDVTIAAAIAALTGPQDLPAQKAKEFSAKRDEVLAVFAGIPGIRCPRPEGAFYVFPDISGLFGKHHGTVAISDDVAFCNQLLESKGVACVPGRAFGEPRALRISYTCKSTELSEGLRRIKEFCSELV
jgi:aspartate aminotransferase